MDIAALSESDWSLQRYQVDIPKHLIAQQPANPRDSSRLLVMRRHRSMPLQHHIFHQLPQLLQPGDVLVINRTKVVPARMQVYTEQGEPVELLWAQAASDLDPCHAQVLAKPRRKLAPGKRLRSQSGIAMVCMQLSPTGLWQLRADEPWPQLLAKEGIMPLPPYIDRRHGPQSSDEQAYQTMFAAEAGAVAAPTAALHFTPRLVEALQQQGICFIEVVLHVGLGTFLPIRPEHREDFRQHPMHDEQYALDDAAIAALQQAQASGRRIIAVGTTSLRALESYQQSGRASGRTNLFIYPGYRFGCCDGLITNFHVPQSTLMLLVSAFSSRQAILEAYQTAVRENYRFFSYGDAMLMLP